MLSGAYIGSGIGRADLLELRFVVFPAVLLLVCYFVNAVLTGSLMHRLFGLGRREAMLAATPGRGDRYGAHILRPWDLQQHAY